jgi:hypothetical protein
MAKRKIVVADQAFEWTTRRHEDDRVTAWAEGSRSGFVAIAFRPGRGQPAGVIAELHGQFLDSSQGFVHSGLRLYNLNRPAVAADLIRAALAREWAPLAGRQLFLDGFALLRDPALVFTPERLQPDALERATQLVERRAIAERRSPIAWLAARTHTRWPDLLRRGPSEALLAAAGLVTLDVLLDTPATLDPARRATLAVWADHQQAHGRPGGLVVAHRLADRPLDTPELLADLERWVAALLDDG